MIGLSLPDSIDIDNLQNENRLASKAIDFRGLRRADCRDAKSEIKRDVDYRRRRDNNSGRVQPMVKVAEMRVTKPLIYDSIHATSPDIERELRFIQESCRRHSTAVQSYIESVLQSLVPAGADAKSWLQGHRCELVQVRDLPEQHLFLDGVLFGRFEFSGLSCRFVIGSVALEDDLMPMYLLRLDRLAGQHGFGAAKEWCRRYSESTGCAALEAIREATEILNSGKPLPNIKATH